MNTVILGLDAFDPTVLEHLLGQGQLPHLAGLATTGGYARFAVANPPQSEVSWTSIATGLNPGHHGIFDFVHRYPASYNLYVSLLPTRRGLTGTEFVPTHQATTIFDYAVLQGYPATSLWWPATFPIRPASPVRVLPGLGTPDIHGRLGVGTLFTTEELPADANRKTPVFRLAIKGKGRFAGQLAGPARQARGGHRSSALDFEFELEPDQIARLLIGKQAVALQAGVWSPIIELSFKVAPFVTVRALTRVILSQVQPFAKLYFLPLQIHPLHTAWRYATPPAFVRQTWQACGPFLTLGWPQDTTGLEDGCITDDQFLSLCDAIVEAQERVLMYQLDNFREGLLAAVVDTLDRVQHMYWRDRPDVVLDWYRKLDGLVGRVQKRLAEKGLTSARLLVVSDHGFSEFDFKVHLNRWLVDRGYLSTRANGGPGRLQDVDWARSTAYAIGLNSLYLNLSGREGQGRVPPEQQEALLAQISAELLQWCGPDGKAVAQQVLTSAQTFEGELAQYGPDLVVGYAPGYRGSSETGLGQWPATSMERNGDHWSGDHCISAEAVPGVLLCNQGLAGSARPSYRDIPVLAVGAELAPRSSPPPPADLAGEDEAIVEERLKSLGYL